MVKDVNEWSTFQAQNEQVQTYMHDKQLGDKFKPFEDYLDQSDKPKKPVDTLECLKEFSFRPCNLDTDEKSKKLFEALDGMKQKTEEINRQFKDPERTTFVAVCIPEFLSMYETQRLSIELAKQDIDIRNIVINQVLFPDPASNCKKCVARRKMQEKYIGQIKEMFDDFHITTNPQLDEEVRGVELLKQFGSLLFDGYTPEWEKK